MFQTCVVEIFFETPAGLQVKLPAMSAQEFGLTVGTDEYYCTMQPWRHQAPLTMDI